MIPIVEVKELNGKAGEGKNEKVTLTSQIGFTHTTILPSVDYLREEEKMLK